MLTQEIPECPFPTLTRNGQLKKYAELFEKKVRVMVEEVCKKKSQNALVVQVNPN